VLAVLVIERLDVGKYDKLATLELLPVIVSKMFEETFTVFVINVPLANHVRTVAVNVIAHVAHDDRFNPVI
jgi:hypothetical protein